MPGPYIQAAFLCEKVLEERDGVMTFMRVVNQLQVESRFEVQVQLVADEHGNPVDEDERAIMKLERVPIVQLVVGLTAGGEVTLEPLPLEIRIVADDGGRRLVGFAGQTNLVEPHDSSWLVVGVDLNQGPTPEQAGRPPFGLYWIEVEIEGEIVSRLPLQVEPGEFPDGQSLGTRSSGPPE